MTFSFSKFKINTKRSNRNIYFQKFLHEKYPMTHIASVCVTIIYNYFYMKIAFLLFFFFQNIHQNAAIVAYIFKNFFMTNTPWAIAIISVYQNYLFFIQKMAI